MSSTSKPKLTMADKGNMKALQRFTQMEMKKMFVIEKIEHGLKVKTTKISNMA